MNPQDFDRRLHDIEEFLELGKKDRAYLKERRALFFQHRWRYHIIARIIALSLAYPFIVFLLWLVGSPRPFIHALAPAVTIVAYLFVAPWVQRLLLKRAGFVPMSERKENTDEL